MPSLFFQPMLSRDDPRQPPLGARSRETAGMRLRRRSKRFRSGLALAVLLAACTPSSDARGPAPGGDPEARAAGEAAPAMPHALMAPGAGADADARAPARGPAASVQRGTGVFVNPEAGARPPVATTEDGEFTLNFAEAEVSDVVRTILGDTLGLNYVIDPDVAGSITMQTSRALPRSGVLPALETVLQLNGATIVEDRGLYRVVPLESGAPPPSSAPLVGLSIEGPEAGYGVRIVPLRYIAAVAMQKILTPFLPRGGTLEVDTDRNVLILAGTGQQLETLLTLVDIFDVDFLSGRSFALVPLQYAAAERVQPELEAIFASEADGALEGVVRFIAVERLNGILAISSRPEYIDQARSWIERLDRGAETGERRLYVYPVQHGRAAYLADLLSNVFGALSEPSEDDQLFPPGVPTVRIGSISGPARPTSGTRFSSPSPTAMAQDVGAGEAAADASSDAAVEQVTQPPAGSAEERSSVPEGGAEATGSEAFPVGQGALRVIADEDNNALVILATPREFRTVQDALRQLDVVPLAVLIEATITEVTLNDQLRYGLQWFFRFGTNSFTFSNTGEQPVPEFPGFSFLGTSNADIRVVLNALESITDLNVVSSPQLVVLNNQEATLQVGDQVPVVTAQAVNLASDDTLINTIQFVDTGVILRVRPRVNASGMVTLELEQEVSDPVGGGLTPTINQRRIQSTVAVEDGETVALGGLIRDRRNNSQIGVPILSRIPILGNAFRTTDRSETRTELLVLLTPSVIRNRAEARRVTDELRQRVHALEALELRIR